MHWQAFHKKKSLYLKAYLTKYVTTQKRICSKTNRRYCYASCKKENVALERVIFFL